MSTHAAARLAWSLCTLTIVLVAFVVVFSVFYRDTIRGLAFLPSVVSVAGTIGAAYLTVRITRRGRNR